MLGIWETKGGSKQFGQLRTEGEKLKLHVAKACAEKPRTRCIKSSWKFPIADEGPPTFRLLVCDWIANAEPLPSPFPHKAQLLKYSQGSFLRKNLLWI